MGSSVSLNEIKANCLIIGSSFLASSCHSTLGVFALQMRKVEKKLHVSTSPIIEISFSLSAVCYFVFKIKLGKLEHTQRQARLTIPLLHFYSQFAIGSFGLHKEATQAHLEHANSRLKGPSRDLNLEP